MFEEYYDMLPEATEKNELTILAEKVETLEKQIAAFKEIESGYKAEKERLLQMMVDNNVKSWKLPNGTTFTVVAEKPQETIYESKFNEYAFRKDNEELYQEYVREVPIVKSGRKGYVKVTLRKEKEND